MSVCTSTEKFFAVDESEGKLQKRLMLLHKPCQCNLEPWSWPSLSSLKILLKGYIEHVLGALEVPQKC